jgi:phosphoglycerate dehydrogenase-like enzyme
MPLRLLIKKIDDDGRLSLVPQFLDTAWEIEVVNTDDLDAFGRALSHADAMVSMSWKWDLPSASHLKLLQLPGAGTDEIDFSRVPAGTAVCNYFTSTEISIPVRARACWKTIAVAWIRASGKGTDQVPTCADHSRGCSADRGHYRYGRIGREVARPALQDKIIACTRTPRREDEFADRVDGAERFDNLLSEADFVVVTSH